MHEALTAENKALARAWSDTSLSGFNITDKSVRRQASEAAKLAQQAVEYFVLNKFSLHLSAHFENNPRVSDEEIQRIRRQDVPSVLLDNRFLELFSKPMREREAFMPPGGQTNPLHDRNVVWATGKDGAIYSHFEMILPAGATITRIAPASVRVRTERLSMQIDVGFEGFGAVLPARFPEFYLGARFGDINSYAVNLHIDVKFAWWALFTPTGWEYYRWLDSFVEEMSKAFSFDRFVADIGWHAALTAHLIQRHAAAQAKTPAKQPLQRLSGARQQGNGNPSQS